METIKQIEHILRSPHCVVTIYDSDNNKLIKEVRKNKNWFSAEDINELYGSVEGLFNHLKQKQYNETTFKFGRIRNEKVNPRLGVEKIIVNIQDNLNNPKNPENPENPKSEMGKSNKNNPDYSGSQMPNLANMQYLGAFVDAERSGDHKKRVAELEEDVKDYRSEIRTLKEENHVLRLKDATSKERTELNIQKALIDKKSFFESDGFQKVTEALGGLVPMIPQFLNKAAPAQLGGADTNLTNVQQQVIQLVKQANPEQTAFILLVINHLDTDLMSLLSNYIDNKSN
ncbi:hypothetical protein G1L02_08270 [Tenacibaculum finnmarkense]|uniref:hypothetical protein n=1 Tax=Tenacibaculum finnmarkense TaxID=2781243 RepID=UPI001E4FEA61|nr:hypothetical protein [Tenacibaculum finnmarkense]MCD8410388.1 hypothetical protein [Tenacibaculum finnmarkense genomovar ulcerans]MCG8883153.1 hypothetical protein [Tenacibaculum finnmarkense]